jgi:adenylate cyclase
MKSERTKGRFRLRIALPVFFSAFLALTGATIFLVNFYFSMQSTQRVAEDYLVQTGNRVIEKTVNYLDPAAKAAIFSAEVLNPEAVRGDYFDQFNLRTIPQFSTYSQIALIYYGSVEGNFWLNGVLKETGNMATQVVERIADTTREGVPYQSAVDLQNQIDAFVLPAEDSIDYEEQQAVLQSLRATLDDYSEDLIQSQVFVLDASGEVESIQPLERYSYYPPARSWFERSSEAIVPEPNGSELGTPVIPEIVKWSGAYPFSDSGRYDVSGKPGITVSHPVLSRNGTLLGVVGVDIVISELQNFLDEILVTDRGRSFIMNQSGTLIAVGNFQQGESLTNNFFRLPILDVVDQNGKGDAAVVRSYEKLVEEHLGEGGKGDLTQAASFSYQVGEETFLAYYAPIPQGDGPPWIIGLVVPEDDFIGAYKDDIFVTVLVSLVVLLVLILLSIFIGHRITYPLKLLVEEAGKIQKLDLADRFLPSSSFKEIANMSSAMSSMKVGLKSFEKYIPADVVRYLVGSGHEAVLGGEARELTIFFSDVADFTTISETLPPKDLIKHLGVYLGEYSRQIAATGGTVDKYIGDAVMAFWNAPNNVEDHAIQACRAALACTKALAEQRKSWKFANQPLFYTRIGLHTGEVIVGNMGSEERLNYTVIGDAVNLSSRLEGLAKVYGVSILVSEVTFEKAQDHFEFRKLDRVTVKGKTIPVTVYELLNPKGDWSPKKASWARSFEKGLDAYFQQNWELATMHFKDAQEKHPKDRACSLFLKRVEFYKNHSPGPSWDGVARYKTK